MQFVLDALRGIDRLVHSGRGSSEAVLRARIKQRIHQALRAQYDPITRNVLSYLAAELPMGSFKTLHEHVLGRIQRAKVVLAASLERMAYVGASKTRGVCAVTLGDGVILRRALRSARRVNVLAGGPGNPGHALVSALGNRAVWYPDVAARAALQDADLIILSCDVVASDSIVAPAGSELLAELAHNRALPVYVLAQGLQYDPQAGTHMHKLSGSVPNPFVRNVYQAIFEHIDPALVTGIISEFGVHPHAHFLEEVGQNYPWMFIH
ncbi:hypothetical protein HY493_02420 [Candidatus Woesearchaeota archaeon]|nr:hypothetical protein [Candidatus Woesearchaeota archaeon]